MTKSVTTTAIRSISEACHAALKPHGFRRKSPHLYRETSDVFHCVHFQASQWGSSESGSFTVNLAVTSPAIYCLWTGRPFPSNPASALWPIQERIGKACGEKIDLWWDVSAITDTAAIAADISDRLQKSTLTFFSQYPTTAAILAEVADGRVPPGMIKPQLPLLHAILLHVAGQDSQATELLERALTQNKVEPFRETILLIACRLNLSLSDSK